MYLKKYKREIVFLVIIFMVTNLLVTILQNYIGIFNVVIKVSHKDWIKSQKINIGYFLKDNALWIYFTIQSNFIALGAIILVFLKLNKWTKYIFICATSYITLTMIIFWTVLSWIMPWNNLYFTLEQVWLHALNPLLTIAIFFLIRKTLTIKSKGIIGFSLIYPFCYLIMSVILYVTIFNQKINIYPFLLFKNPFWLDIKLGWAVLVDIMTIILFCIGQALITYLYYKMINQKSKSRL
jgi:hypothetical protein